MTAVKAATLQQQRHYSDEQHRVSEGQTSSDAGHEVDVPLERKLNHLESDISTDTSSSDSDTFSDTTQLLRLETISDKHARVRNVYATCNLGGNPSRGPLFGLLREWGGGKGFQLHAAGAHQDT
jgi:hypothetical protein